jgi:hypothetical protein
MNSTIQIAQVLNVSPNQIKSVREMAWVYCVVVFGQRATFVSKKKVEAVTVAKTKWDIAVEIAALIGGKPWQGGDKVRVYLGKGFVEVGANGLNAKSLNNHNAYSAIREAGLDSYQAVSAAAAVSSVRRGTCLNCDITASVLLGRGYCTDCYGEC